MSQPNDSEIDEVHRSMMQGVAYSPENISKDIDMDEEKAKACLEKLFDQDKVVKKPGPNKEDMFYIKND